MEPVNDPQNKNIRNCLINGEGMIYRLDFHHNPYLPSPEIGKAWMATRIVKTPDHYADLALWQDGEQNKIVSDSAIFGNAMHLMILSYFAVNQDEVAQQTVEAFSRMLESKKSKLLCSVLPSLE